MLVPTPTTHESVAFAPLQKQLAINGEEKTRRRDVVEVDVVMKWEYGKTAENKKSETSAQVKCFVLWCSKWIGLCRPASVLQCIWLHADDLRDKNGTAAFSAVNKESGQVGLKGHPNQNHFSYANHFTPL